ncbi:glycosyltransferase family 4 protein [Cycloclasticus pugetii]|uniref:glycosyltransferase family 4 protein n=1 Tax=Cycloclasticus pugetii TaxID=34068 RepID=UPI003A9435B4
MEKVFVIGATAKSLVNFRGELLRSMVKNGFEVTAISPEGSPEEVEKIKELGVNYKSIPLLRTSINPLIELKTFFNYFILFRKYEPDHLLCYTIKPVIWSGLALLFTSRKVNFTALITGLGYAFEGNSLKRKLLRFIVVSLYKISLTKSNNVIFQNNDDLNFFHNEGVVSASKCSVVPGSGVPMDYFSRKDLPDMQPFKFLMVSRLLKEKGVFQYVDAARMIRNKYSNVEFHLVGGLDLSHDGITKYTLAEWEKEGTIIYHGEQNDVRPYLNDCHVFVLPSYYREGLPRTILEAMAIGRPILTTDNVGCREPVDAGNNGWLVPIKDSVALADRMQWFLENKDKIENMSLFGYETVKERYDVRKINKSMMEIMGII